MALKDLQLTWVDSGNVESDPQSGDSWTTYVGALTQWNTVGRLVQSSETSQRVYLTPVPDTPPSDYSRDTTELLDSYTVPADPTAPGYDAAAVGKYRRIYHDGNGDVARVDDNLDVAATGVAPNAVGGSGQVRATPTGGVAPLTLLLVETGATLPGTAGQPTTFPGVPTGTYTVRVTESSTPAGVATTSVTVPAAQVWGCTDPTATNLTPGATADDGSCVYTPPVVAPIFSVPLLNALRFVLEAAPDDCQVFETPDNQLFCQQTRPGQRVRPLYYQAVARCDVHRLQVLTTYAAVAATVRTAAGQVVATVAGQRVLQLAGEAPPIGAVLADNGDGWTRLLADPALDSPLPENLLRVKRVTLAGATAGTYRVRQRGATADGTAYLVLQRSWTEAVAGAITVSWQLLGPGYDVWEVELNWAALPAGDYTVELRGTDPAQPDALAVSEPVRLAEQHPHTVLVEYKNQDNAYGLIWATGLTVRLRVGAVFFRPALGGTLTVHRGSGDQPTVLQSTARRGRVLETQELPDWLHEKLFLACRLDWLRVNGLRYVAPEAYEAGEQTTYPLTNGRVVLEQREWLGTGNSTDSGSVDAGTDSLQLLRQGGFVKLRR